MAFKRYEDQQPEVIGSFFLAALLIDTFFYAESASQLTAYRLFTLLESALSHFLLIKHGGDGSCLSALLFRGCCWLLPLVALAKLLEALSHCDIVRRKAANIVSVKRQCNPVVELQ